MAISHPFEKLSLSVKKRAFLVFLVLALVIMALLNIIGAPLITDAAPAGIVSYELAKNIDMTAGILASWDETARISAGLSLGFDYLFMVAYSVAIALACVLSAGLFRSALTSLGMILAWLQFVAAILDAIENYALIRLLYGAVSQPWPLIAWACAIPKFAFVLLGILYALVGLIALMVVSAKKKARVDT
ncbi:MAG: hypothetical protein JW920_07660 [Deltaproteobacteria bacterium]|nr:hypothetical protein [Deltaproteobacteria bacterium]